MSDAGDREETMDGHSEASPWTRIRAGLAPVERGEPPGEAAHGVLVPLLERGGAVWALYTRRAEHLSAHPGEVSFPGGGFEPGDGDLVETALREAREEVGLRPEDVTVLGRVADVETLGGRRLRAVAGRVAPDARLADPTTPDEVAERLLVPLTAMRDGRGEPADVGEPVAAGEGTFGRAYGVRTYEARRLDEGARDGVIHYWRLDADTTVWGLTGEVTARLLAAVFDWSPPATPREVSRDEVQP